MHCWALLKPVHICLQGSFFSLTAAFISAQYCHILTNEDRLRVSLLQCLLDCECGLCSVMVVSFKLAGMCVCNGLWGFFPLKCCDDCVCFSHVKPTERLTFPNIYWCGTRKLSIKDKTTLLHQIDTLSYYSCFLRCRNYSFQYFLRILCNS